VSSNLNLASKPFNNRVLPWTLTVLILFFSLIGLILVVRLTTSINSQTAQVTAEMNQSKAEEQTLMKAVENVEESLTEDQLSALPAAHQLVNRKRFVWTRLLVDLESALPGSVKVSRIAVRNVSSDGTQTIAELELALFATSATTISDMISAMNKGGTFNATLDSQTLQKGRGETGSEYELTVIYRPRAGYSTESVAEVTKGSEVVR
jgi:Tfp pilus assembly protein PilN